MSHAGRNDPSDLLNLMLVPSTPMPLPTPPPNGPVLRRDIHNMLAPHEPCSEIALRETFSARRGEGLEGDLELGETRVQSRSHDTDGGEGSVHGCDGVAGHEEGEDRDVGFWGQFGDRALRNRGEGGLAGTL